MAHEMISVRDAQKKILEAVPVRSSIEVPLRDAVCRIVAETVRSPIEMPSFDNSAMDGYALRSEDTCNASEKNPVFLKVTRTVAAGDNPVWELKGGEAARIFTGAMVPAGANAVIAQEDVQVSEDGIVVQKAVSEGNHVRWHGEELSQGDVVLQQGDAIRPAGIGLLASLGIQNIKVYSPGRIGIVVTGSEIITKQKDFAAAKIFDSNSFALSAALKELFLTPTFVKHCSDDKLLLQKTIADGFAESDFLIVTGGVSVGDFDFVREMARDNGVEEVFWGVRQKPGKPIFFGKKGSDKFLFGLPGNPASALVCFYEYVRVALLRSMGASSPLLPRLSARLRGTFKKRSARVHFVRGCLSANSDGNYVEILEKQGSHMMKSFAEANCLVVIPRDKNHIEEGETVDIDLLPSAFLNLGGDSL